MTGAALALAMVAAKPARAAKCTNCNGENGDPYNDFVDAEILPTKPLCTDVCTNATAPGTLCNVYTTPYVSTLTNCGTFGVSSTSPGGVATLPVIVTPTCGIKSMQATSFSASKAHSQSFGSGFIGAGYSLSASISGKDTSITGAQGDIVELAGNVKVTGTLFNNTKTLAEVNGTSKSEYGVSTSGSLSAYVYGLASWSQSWNVPLYVSKVWTKTFFEQSYPIQLGIYTVSLKGGVSGEVRLQASGGPTTTGLAGTFTPSAKAYATASASIGVFGLGVGVEGQLTLLEVGVPVQAAANFVNGVVSWAISIGVTLKSLAGKLKVKITIPLAPDPSWTIFSWSGYSTTWQLFNLGGCTSLQKPLMFTASKL
jgi:hypothetical protein